MKVLLLVLVVIAALFVIASGVWVAFALAAVVSSSRPETESEPDTPENGSRRKPCEHTLLNGHIEIFLVQ